METNLISMALIEIFTSVILGILVLYFMWSIVRARFRKKYKFEEINLAFAIFCCGIFLSIGNLMSGSIQPIINTMRVLNPEPRVELSAIWNSFLYIIIFIAIGLLMSLIIIYLGISFFKRLTRDVDEIQEITKNNIGIAILFATILFIISMFAKDGYVLLLESLIPYPQSAGIL